MTQDPTSVPDPVLSASSLLASLGLGQDQPRCDLLAVCHSAVVTEGRLSILGAFLDDARVDFTGPIPVGIAMHLTFPHHLTGRSHTVRLWWEDLAGERIGDDDIHVVMNLPRSGRPHRAPVAMTIPLKLSAPADVVLVVALQDGPVLGRTELSVGRA